MHLPKDALVVNNLDVSMKAAVNTSKVDLVEGKKYADDLQAVLAENSQLREKLAEASLVIENYASTNQQLDFRVGKLNYSNSDGYFSYQLVLGIPISKRSDLVPAELNLSESCLKYLERQHENQTECGGLKKLAL